MKNELKLESIKRELEQLRRVKIDNLINVSNAEWYSLFKDEIRNSIAIEGVFANRTDLIDVLENNKRTDKHKAASILGYFESASAMYEYAVNQYKEKEFSLRMSDIKQIHTLLMRYEKEMGFYIGDLGELRKTRAEVAQSTFTPISEFYVRPAMELFIKWIHYHLSKNIYNPIELAAISHVWFESIHPFRDGNGRVGRILLSYILIGCGLINIAIKGISKKDRNHYYDALEQADNAFEDIHRKMEQGEKFDVAGVDQLIKLKVFDEIKTIILDRLNDSVGRLKEIDIHNINKEAELSLSELARIYNYSSDYLRNLINRGKLKGRKKGKTWYVRVRDMAAYAEEAGNGA
jgi:Fic family protein